MNPDPDKIKAFRSAKAMEKWMRANHDQESELWLRIFRKGSDLASVSLAEALDIALCWGWIDGIRKAHDKESYLQRYTPRARKSVWSQINRDHVARLTAAGRMTAHGQRQVDAARADGRWQAAYAPIRSVTREHVPADLRAAIDASARARRSFESINRQTLFALVYRTNAMKTAAGRARKIAELVKMLETRENAEKGKKGKK